MRLKEKYQKEIIEVLKKELGYKNDFEVPRLLKVSINVGFGRHVKDKTYINHVVKSLTSISGQKPILTKAKKSISSFKIRQGMIIGASVSLRGQRMYDFVEKLINITFPRVRDFRGVSKKIIDKSGNLTIGFKEHLAFPEIKGDDVENIFGLEVSLSTTAKTKKEGLELFRLMGFPFKKE